MTLSLLAKAMLKVRRMVKVMVVAVREFLEQLQRVRWMMVARVDYPCSY